MAQVRPTKPPAYLSPPLLRVPGHVEPPPPLVGLPKVPNRELSRQSSCLVWITVGAFASPRVPGKVHHQRCSGLRQTACLNLVNREVAVCGGKSKGSGETSARLAPHPQHPPRSFSITVSQHLCA